MICLSSRLSSLVSSSALRAFNFPAIDVNVTATSVAQSSNEFDYISSISKDLFEKHRMDMSKYWKGDQLFASGIASEITVQLPSNLVIQNCGIDSLGRLGMVIRNDCLESGIKHIAQTTSARHLRLAASTQEKKKHVVVFPFAQIAEKPSLNTFRGANISETLARLIEVLQADQDVVRVGVIQNSQPFHGIVYAYLAATQSSGGLDPKTGALDFKKLAAFIAEQGLASPAEIAELGARTVDTALSHPTSDVRVLMDKLSDAATGNFMEVYAKLTAKEINVIRESQILTAARENFTKLESRNKLERASDSSHTFLTANKNISLLDPSGCLTKQGMYLAVVQYLERDWYAEQVHSTCGVQDEAIHRDIDECLKAGLGFSANLSYYPHNDLFAETDSKTGTANIKSIMRQLNVQKYKQRFPEIMPNLVEEQSEIFLDQCLGWTRFLDHKKTWRRPYLMSVENVVNFVHTNEVLTNARSEILEMLASYTSVLNGQTIGDLSQGFSLRLAEERNLARTLLQFPDVVHLAFHSATLTVLPEYAELLLSYVSFLKKGGYLKSFNETDKLTKEEILNKVVLLDATNKVIQRLFYIVGVLNH